MEPLKAMYPVCTLIKSDGTRCGSPALTGMNFCFHHIGGRVPTPKPETRRVNTPLKLAYPSCHEAIQHNLFLVMQALSEGKIDNATAITYDRLLRSAQLNLHRWQKSKLNQDEVEQQMMPCAPVPAPESEPEPAPSPAFNGYHPERSAERGERSLLAGVETGVPDTRDVRVTGLGGATGVPSERSLLAGVETGVHDTRDVRVTGLGSATGVPGERSLFDGARERGVEERVLSEAKEPAVPEPATASDGNHQSTAAERNAERWVYPPHPNLS